MQSPRHVCLGAAAVADDTMAGDDTYLWWLMVVTGIAAAALSLCATLLDRRPAATPTSEQRFKLHIASYVLMSVSILTFIFRELILPS